MGFVNCDWLQILVVARSETRKETMVGNQPVDRSNIAEHIIHIRWRFTFRLCQQLFDDIPMHISESTFDSVVIKSELRMIDAQKVQSRCV